MKINRLLQLIMILMNRQHITVKYLAEHFEVSRKTIYRDLETLITSGIPVCYGENAKGYVYIMEGYSLKYAVLPTRNHESEIFDLSKLRDTDARISQNEMEALKEAWHTFMAQKQFDLEDIKQEISHSWRRCQRESVPLYHFDIKHILSPEEVKKHLIENMKEYEKEGFKLFDHVVKNLGLNIVISDLNGITKYIFNQNMDFTNMYPKIGYFSDSSESAIGTSASCLSLIENKPTKVIGAEHYNQLLHDYSGAAAPFYENGELAGVVNTFFLHASVTNQTLNVMYGLARLYESLIIKGAQIIPSNSENTNNPHKVERKSFDHLVGKSAEWQMVLNAAKSLSHTESPLLIKGEEGVGKSSLAKCIHSQSQRREGPCISFDCQSVPEELLKMTLLSYSDKNKEDRKGLFESAIGGTLVLSNVELLSKELQKSLYTFLKSKKLKRISSNKMDVYDVRVIVCTTLGDLSELYQPLKEILEIIQLKIPPLRERPSDIRAIVRYCMNKVSGPINIDPKVLATIVKKLEREAWSGNVRELLNKVEKILVLESEREKYLK